ncbi:LCCL domain-containing protein [Muricoccus radiodurans]|uniref:LCCL domain-containing protein n=1 Tax=Muricoccus radiodurans TaxID=2231721 RepID=UPI003CEF0ED3
MRRALAGVLPLLALAFAAAAQPSRGSLMPCPETLEGFGAMQPGACACWQPVAAPVRGTDVYTPNSAICAAAVHAGVITMAGGTVSVVPAPGQSRYPGSTRNGITSNDAGPADRSFRVERMTGSYGTVPR